MPALRKPPRHLPAPLERALDDLVEIVFKNIDKPPRGMHRANYKAHLAARLRKGLESDLVEALEQER